VNPNLLSIILTIALCGCGVRPPLKVHRHGERLGVALGFESEEVEFLNRCFFDEVPKSYFGKADPVRGIVVLTKTAFFISEGNLNQIHKKRFRKIPIDEIDRVGLSSSQVLIEHGDEVVVLAMYGWNDLNTKPSLASDLFELLVLADVPGFQTGYRNKLSKSIPVRPGRKELRDNLGYDESDTYHSVSPRD